MATSYISSAVVTEDALVGGSVDNGQADDGEMVDLLGLSVMDRPLN